MDFRGEKYRIESRILRLRGLGAARRAFNAILANVRLRGMCVLADDVGFCAIKTGGGGALLGSLVGMDRCVGELDGFFPFSYESSRPTTSCRHYQFGRRR